MNILSELENRGWFLSQEGIDILSLENPKTVEEYITLAKDVRKPIFCYEHVKGID